VGFTELRFGRSFAATRPGILPAFTVLLATSAVVSAAVSTAVCATALIAAPCVQFGQQFQIGGQRTLTKTLLEKAPPDR